MGAVASLEAEEFLRAPAWGVRDTSLICFLNSFFRPPKHPKGREQPGGYGLWFRVSGLGFGVQGLGLGSLGIISGSRSG